MNNSKLKFNQKFARDFAKFATQIKHANNKIQVAKISGKHIQPLVEYFDDDGLNLLTEKGDFQFGYILIDNTLAKGNYSYTHINPDFLYFAKRLEEPNKNNKYVSVYSVKLPSETEIFSFLKELVNYGKQTTWTDNSKLTKTQVNHLLALVK